MSKCLLLFFLFGAFLRSPACVISSIRNQKPGSSSLQLAECQQALLVALAIALIIHTFAVKCALQGKLTRIDEN